MHFDQKKRTALENLLDSKNYPESLNFVETHAYLTALQCGPSSPPVSEAIKDILFGDSVEKIPEDEPAALISELYLSIEKALFSGEKIDLPCKLTIDQEGQTDDTLQDWLYGFFEAHFSNDESWYQKDEALVAEMLLPFLVAFDEIEDEDLKLVRKDNKLMQNLISQIPQAIQDLYLFYRSE